MADNVKAGFALKPETIKIIDEISEKTFRSKSAVIDWLVAEAWERMQEVRRPVTSLAEAIEPKEAPVMEGGN